MPETRLAGRVVRRGTEGYENLRRGLCWHDHVPKHYPEGQSCLYAEWGTRRGEDKHTHWVADHMRAFEPYATGTALPDENRLNRPFPFISDNNLRRLEELRESWDPEGRLVSWLGAPQLLT